MSPDRLLMLVAAEAAREGMTCPQLDHEPARTAAERLISAVGLTHPAPPRQLAAAPDATRELPPAREPAAVGAMPRHPWPSWTGSARGGAR